MSVLRTIETKIEGLFEGVFGRAFRTHVQPVELARKLAKEMDEHRSVSVSRVYVPNEYTIYLSDAPTAQQFASYEGSLSASCRSTSPSTPAGRRYALLTPPRCRFATDDDLAVGEFGIATRVAQPEDGAAARSRRPPRCASRRGASRSRASAPPGAAPGRRPRVSDLERRPRRSLPAASSRLLMADALRPRREVVTLTLEGRDAPDHRAQRRDRPLPRVRPPGRGRQRLAPPRRDRQEEHDLPWSSTSARRTVPS